MLPRLEGDHTQEPPRFRTLGVAGHDVPVDALRLVKPPGPMMLQAGRQRLRSRAHGTKNKESTTKPTKSTKERIREDTRSPEARSLGAQDSFPSITQTSALVETILVRRKPANS